MRVFSLLSAVFLVAALRAMASDLPANCKPITHLGVSGCELLPDQTCPKGYHKEVVGPPNPQMKAPSRLMCVPDKPLPKKKETKKPPPAPTTS